MNVRNGERYLPAAIQSILNQSSENWELIVVDDGSQDRSAEIVHTFADPRIRLVEMGSHVGIPRSINRGIALARGELIAHQDADDVSHPLRLERQAGFMDAHPNVAGIGTRFRVINGQGRSVHYWPGDLSLPITYPGIRWALLFGTGFVHSSIMFRRSIGWDELGGYDENYPRAQDYEFLSRLAYEHLVLNLPEKLVSLRRHSWSNTQKKPIPIDTLEQLFIRTFQQTLKSNEFPAGNWTRNYVASYMSSAAIDRETASSLVQRFDWIYTRFNQVYPNTAPNPEVIQGYAFQLATLASHLARKNCRRESIRAYVKALRADWRIAFLVMPKYFAFLSLGDGARNVWRGLTRT